MQIFEEFNDIVYLLGDKLTFTIATEHTIPTPTIDPTHGINTKSYRILKIDRKSKGKPSRYCVMGL